mmetsp:Transcript_10736/g.45707  ORF Transcript_10736/g.45707 Transcript_10736/m.45707 type:complete len:207 (-) Transcript_10736:1137-1757(-)
MVSGTSPDNEQPAIVSSSKLVSAPSHVGNLPLMRLFPLSESRAREVMPLQASGIFPLKLFRTSSPLSPRYSTSSFASAPIAAGNGPESPLALTSRCLKFTSSPKRSLSPPSRRLLDSTSDCSLVMENSSSGIKPEKRLSDKSRYRSSSSFANAVALNLPQHATLFRFIHSSVTRPPTHTTPCHPLAQGSPTSQFFCTLQRGPLHSS